MMRERFDKYAHLRTDVHPRLDGLLTEMWRKWKHWTPAIGFPSHSAGFFGGGHYSVEDFEDDCDSDAARVTDTAWRGLGPAHRIAVEVVYARLPDVATTARAGGLEQLFRDAIEQMEVVMRREGIL